MRHDGYAAPDDAAWIRELMLRLGSVLLVASDETVAASVWVEEDKAPGGIAGYYERRRVPARHQLDTDTAGHVTLAFTLDGLDYVIRSRGAKTGIHNMHRVADVLRTVERWVEEGLTTRDAALAGFRRGGAEWWFVLRVAPDATLDEIEQAFRRLAHETHPDRGGTADAFRAVRAAYEAARAATGVG